MDGEGVTMLVMADKPKKRGRPPKGRTPAFTVFARIKSELGERLVRHVDSIEPKTTLAAVVELAIRQYLDRQATED